MKPSGIHLTGRDAATISIAALVVRWLDLWLQSSLGTDFLAEDANLYWILADGIVSSGSAFGVMLSDGTFLPHSERAPLYPYFLAGLKALGVQSIQGLLVVQSLVDAATCILIASMAGLWSRRGAIAAGLMAASTPALFLFSNSVLTETLFLFLFSLFLLSCLLYMRAAPTTSQHRQALVLGGLLGALTLCRGVLLPGVPVILAVLGAVNLRKYGDSRLSRRLLFAATGVVMACFAFVAVLSPYLARNHAQFGAMSLSSQTGTHLLFWVVPLVEQQVSGRPFGDITSELRQELEKRIAVLVANPERLGPFERGAIATQLGFEKLGEQPLSAVVSAWLRGAIFNLAAPTIALHPQVRALKSGSFYEGEGAGLVDRAAYFLKSASPAYVALIGVGAVLNGLVMLAALWGLFLVARYYPAIAVIAVALVIYISLINGPVVSPKYRLPLEPVFIALAGIGLADLWGRRRPRG